LNGDEHASQTILAPILSLKLIPFRACNKVTRCALENAASVAGVVLLTEATIVDKPEEKKSNEGFGDMGGMY